MWFKQLQLFQFHSSLNLSSNTLIDKLESLAFRSCLPSMEKSMGWISPLDSDDVNAPLIRSINGYTMLCLQIEEKILPASVIRHELAKKIKQIESEEDRKVRQSEKLSLKDEIKLTLLPRAFSKFTKLYAYIDVKNRRVILGTANAKKAEQFIMMFKKSVSEDISSVDINKLSPIITHWIKDQDYPSSFSIEKSCVLQDPNQQGRIIRCQQQDLFTIGVRSLIKDGCEVKQLAINWQDRVNFILSDDLSLKSLKFQDEITAQVKEMEPETQDQQFDADFLIMTDTLSQVLDDLLIVFNKKNPNEITDRVAPDTNKITSLIETA